jgi:hypothetical protein
MSGKPPQAAEIDWHGDLQEHLAPESEVIQITIYRSAVREREPSRDGHRRSHDPDQR